MFFIILMIITTLSIAGSAAFFSIYGLAAIFSGAFIPVIIMGTALESGKLIAASYVYRFWDRVSFLMKTYLITAIVTLMVITSVGIFGFLSAAYQESVMKLKELETKVETLEDRRETLTEKKAKLDETLENMPDNYVTKREEFISSDQYQRTTKQIDKVENKLHQARVEKIDTKVHTGPITYIASAFDLETDDATKYLLLLIIFAFDPLAVVLTIGSNLAILERKKDKDAEKKRKQEENDDEPTPAIQEEQDLESMIDQGLSESSEDTEETNKDSQDQREPEVSEDQKEHLDRLVRREQTEDSIRKEN